MNGIYYRTIQRNEQTGETYFYISPLEPVSFAEDGLVKCYGIIGFYAYKMPIKLKGEYKDGIFLVDSESLPDDDRNDMEIVLNYVAQDDLTENQKNKILDFGNLFELADKNNAVDFFNNIKVDEKIAHRIIKKLQFLKAREKMTKFLLKENIPVDRIDFLISKNIGVPDIKASPYSIFALADMDIYHADVFAVKNCGMTAYSMQRLIGWISDTIRFSTDSGNCCISMESLERIVNARLKKSVFPETEVNIALLNFCLTEMGKKYCIKAVHEIPYVYENKIWDEENSIISDIHRLQNTPVEVCRKIFPDEIGKQERIIYTKGQRKCFDSLKTSGIKIITGPPGSGKTAVIKGLIRQYSQEIGGNIRLAATTGRAAQVLSKSTEMDAVTVNKLLDIRPFETAVPGKNINEPLNADLIIVDEVSMLGLELASFLLSAIKNQAVLILVGDKDQLPSVDYGNILADFIGCGLIETYYLTEVMRQHGTILDNSQLINHGMVFESDDSELKDMVKEDKIDIKSASYIAGIEDEGKKSELKEKIKSGEDSRSVVKDDINKRKAEEKSVENFKTDDKSNPIVPESESSAFNTDENSTYPLDIKEAAESTIIPPAFDDFPVSDKDFEEDPLDDNSEPDLPDNFFESRSVKNGRFRLTPEEMKNLSADDLDPVFFESDEDVDLNLDGIEVHESERISTLMNEDPEKDEERYLAKLNSIIQWCKKMKNVEMPTEAEWDVISACKEVVDKFM